MEQETVDTFLKELTQLSQKYNIFIGGCGCCGSPFLYHPAPSFVNSPFEKEIPQDQQVYTVVQNVHNNEYEMLECKHYTYTHMLVKQRIVIEND